MIALVKVTPENADEVVDKYGYTSHQEWLDEIGEPAVGYWMEDPDLYQPEGAEFAGSKVEIVKAEIAGICGDPSEMYTHKTEFIVVDGVGYISEYEFEQSVC